MRSSSDYRRVYRRGRRLHGRLAVFHVRRNDVGHARLGFTAGRRVGGAVERDRLPAVDVVVHLKPAAAAADRRTFYGELDRLFETVTRQGAPGERSRGHGRSRR